MPLIITRQSAHEIQADMMICIRRGETAGGSEKRDFLRDLFRKLRPARKSDVRCVCYTAETGDSAFERSYEKALKWAESHRCESVAVSCEDETAFLLANPCSKQFVKQSDLQIWLCMPEGTSVYSSAVAALEDRLFRQEAPVQTEQTDVWTADLADFGSALPKILDEDLKESFFAPKMGQDARTEMFSDLACEPLAMPFQEEDCGFWDEEEFASPPMPCAPEPLPKPTATRQDKPKSRKLGTAAPKEAKSGREFRTLQEFLRQNDAGFKDTLLKYIDRTGKKDSEIYRKGNIDRRLFSKIMNIPGYNPSKPTTIAFAIALELNLEETKDLIGRAGYTLSQASIFDRIIEFFILEGNYDIHEINEALHYFDQSLLGC